MRFVAIFFLIVGNLFILQMTNKFRNKSYSDSFVFFSGAEGRGGDLQFEIAKCMHLGDQQNDITHNQ